MVDYPPPSVSVDAYAFLQDRVSCISVYLGTDGTRMRLEAQYTVLVLHHPTPSRPIVALFTPRWKANAVNNPMPYITALCRKLHTSPYI